MTPQEFIAKWKPVELSERSACQQHFLDLCELLVQPKPAAADPEGAWYTFERGVNKTTGGYGWADVWMRGYFGWEYKKKRRNLAEAYQQLLLYREDLENPPLLVVCDLDRFEIHTNFTGTTKRVYSFDLDGLAKPNNLDVLRKLFTDPQALRPGETTAGVTEMAAAQFGKLADGMRLRGIPAPQAAHFLMKLMFCMFGEDIGLLQGKMFSRIMQRAKNDPQRLGGRLHELFAAMAKGGDFGADEVAWFNGGLFADADVVELTRDEVQEVIRASEYDWADVEPSIFGTLFERTLDPAKRTQIGAHYTSEADIRTLLDPVVLAPLGREWDAVRAECDKLWAKIPRPSGGKAQLMLSKKVTKERRAHDRKLQDFVERLAHVRVLDPACGSGNFLYVAIRLLMDLEKEAVAYGAGHGTTLLPQVRPTQLAGIEINPYAQQLAQVVIWIGYLQWKHQNGFEAPRNPVLEPIESIELMDAILNLSDPEHPREPEWPEADFIIGNPPFLGDKKMRAELGDEYVLKLRRLYEGRLPHQSDLCCYWFEKARQQLMMKKCSRVGLLATQGIRGGANRTCLERIKATADIFWAWSDREWILDGATVHVSMIAFDDGSECARSLNGHPTVAIHANLTSGSSADITKAKALRANAEKCFLGVMKAGAFDIPASAALDMLRAPNVNGRANSDVLRPRLTGRDVLSRGDADWIIDFGCDTTVLHASQYEKPWEHLEKLVKPAREANRRRRLAKEWWIHGEPRPGLRRAVSNLSRFLITPEVSKHRIFVWLDAVFLADHQTRVFATADDLWFGILHSRTHETWARAQGTQLRERESGFRYTPTTCFETFPFPEPSKDQQAAIGAAAKELDQLRTRWLNPPEWVREEVLEFPGSIDGPWARYVHDPDSRGIGTVRSPRLVPRDADCATQLNKRTLTNLYNQRPAWLDLAHRHLDEAVFAAYGWDAEIPDEELLAKLLELNLAREPAR